MSIKDSDLLRAVAQFSFISIEIVACTAVPVALGYWLNHKFGLPQVMITLIGFLGFGFGIFRIWKRLESQERQDGN